MKKVLFGLMLLAVSNVSQADYSKEQAWIYKGKEAVKSKLKDPNSAEFKGSFFKRGADNIPVSCGWVNSKNGFGGYGGFQRYVSAARPDLTWLEEQMPDFQVLWNRFCK